MLKVLAMNKLRMFFAAVICLHVVACTGDNMTKDTFNYGSIKNAAPDHWRYLAEKRIFFAHKSVGNNIIDGMQEILKNHQEIRLNILKTDNPSDIQPGTFAHSAVGENGDPQSKITDFVNMMNSGIGTRADIAFFKFCYVDITSATNVKAIFQEYHNAMAGLKKAYPHTTFVHVTAPLMWNEPNFPKGLIKRVLGRGGEADNVARNVYNELLRKEYSGKEPIFDLARLESIRADATINSFSWKGGRYQALVSDYTDDGGHLSVEGKRVMAEQLLVFLSDLKS